MLACKKNKRFQLYFIVFLCKYYQLYVFSNIFSPKSIAELREVNLKRYLFLYRIVLYDERFFFFLQNRTFTINKWWHNSLNLTILFLKECEVKVIIASLNIKDKKCIIAGYKTPSSVSKQYILVYFSIWVQVKYHKLQITESTT